MIFFHVHIFVYRLVTVVVCFHFEAVGAELVNATECPLKQEEWREKAKSYQCSGGTQYICILNEVDSFVEGCLPPSSPVSPNMSNCPIFISSTQTMAQWKYYTYCNSTWTGCPPEYHGGYFVTELWKYRLCLIRKSEREQGILNDESTTVITTTEATTQAPKMSTSHMTTGGIVGIVFGIIIALLLVTACGWIIYRWRKSGEGFVKFCRDIKRRGWKATLWENKNDNIEMQEMPTLEEQPCLPQDASTSIHYLTDDQVLQRHPCYPKDNHGRLLKPTDLVDLVIVYHQSDYEEVTNEFKPWLRKLIEQEESLREQGVLICMFDKENFTPSYVGRIEDIVNKGMIVLLFLTSDFVSDKSLDLLVESGIWKTRLEHIPNAGKLEEEMEKRKYSLRPVHTEPPETRRTKYRTPTGPDGLYGIDYYDKEKAYVQEKTIDLIKVAVKDRKNLALRMEEALLGM